MNTKFKNFFMVAIMLLLLILIGCNNKNGAGVDDVIKVSYTGFGAMETVGGSLHKLSVGTENYVIDVGSFYGDEGSNYPLPSELDVKAIDAIFITHAHADHIGRLPLLLENGYEGPIYMTSVTKDIAIISTLSNLIYSDLGIERFYYSRNNNSDAKPVYIDGFNYGEFQVEDHNKMYINTKRSELNQKGFYLSGSTVDFLKMEMRDRLEDQIVVVDYEESINLSEEVAVEFFYTSHLPGSSMIYFTIGDKNILFSGDIGSNNNPLLLRNSRFNHPIDYLFVEGTYGTNVNEYDTNVERQQLIEYMGSAIENNERIIIPAFAVDRSQQILYEIRNGMMQSIIPEDTNVKVYSPTIEEFINLYTSYSLDKENYTSYFSDNMFTDIFKINNLIVNPRQTGNSAYDLNVAHGEIAIMTSGMFSSGFSKEILKNYINDDNTNLISVSYQDPDEVGGLVFGGDEVVTIDNVEYQMQAKIFSSPAFSGHANVEQIIDIFKEHSPEQIMIVHLNDRDKDSLIDYYSEQFQSSKIIVPELKKQYSLYEY
ncbi:MAG TPA: MBL fold metallo-hydrolase [Bacilli bacterium]|nr:MBL fold metallo-hydrolase [Bacilli bacterium]